MADTKASAFTAQTGAALAVGDLFPSIDISAVGNLKNTVLTTAELVIGLNLLGLARLSSNTFTDVQTLAPTTPGSALVITSGIITTNLPFFTGTQTWNSSGVTFAGVKWTFTDTASAAGSLPFQILGGAAGTTNLFSIDKSGALLTMAGGTLMSSGGGSFLATSFRSAEFYDSTNSYWAAGSTYGGVSLRAIGQIGWSSTAFSYDTRDTGIARDSAGVVRISNGSSGTGSLIASLITANGGLTIASGQVLKLGSTATAAIAVASTVSLTVQDATGTTYKLLATT